MRKRRCGQAQNLRRQCRDARRSGADEDYLMADCMDPRISNPTAVTVRSLSPSINSNARDCDDPATPVFRVIWRAQAWDSPAVGGAERSRPVEIADRAHVRDDGRVVYEGPAAELGWMKNACSRLPVRAARTRPSHDAAGAFPLNRYWTVAVRPAQPAQIWAIEEKSQATSGGLSPIRTVVSLRKR
jgi:hypothetical protein